MQEKIKTKTAIQWFVDELSKADYIDENSSIMNYVIKEAKKIEKKQIMEAWLTTKPITYDSWKNQFEKYYNETFEKK